MVTVKACCEQDILCEVSRVGRSLAPHAYLDGPSARTVGNSGLHSHHFLTFQKEAYGCSRLQCYDSPLKVSLIVLSTTSQRIFLKFRNIICLAAKMAKTWPLLLLPLEKVTDKQLQTLGEILWSWSLCEECRTGQSCTTESCPLQRFKRLGRFFEHYKDLTASYEADAAPGERAALNTHEDLFAIIKQLKLEPDITRAEFAAKVFRDDTCRRVPSSADRERAINLAVKVMAMVNCSAERQSSGLLEYGLSQAPWRGDVTFSQFIIDIFPMTDHPSLNDDDLKGSMDLKAALMAKKLKKRIGLKLQPTDDLRRHLKLDRKNRVLEIYHHTAFLKEHLRLTKDKTPNMSVSEYIRL